MTGCERDEMDAAKECLLPNIVMSVATPGAGLDKLHRSDSPGTNSLTVSDADTTLN